MDLLHDKMVTLYESIENISDVKSLEEKYQQQMEDLEEKFRLINSDEIEKMVKLRVAIKKVEQTEKDNKFIIEQKNLVVKEKDRLVRFCNNAINQRD